MSVLPTRGDTHYIIEKCTSGSPPLEDHLSALNGVSREDLLGMLISKELRVLHQGDNLAEERDWLLTQLLRVTYTIRMRIAGLLG